MCGICGQINFARNEPVDPDTIRQMAESIRHRGPDDDGFLFDGPVGLGFRRLSIIDLAGGHQPMCDAEESIWVVFNGEIYNYPELRIELESLGYQFRTRSDTEVLIHAYKEWGTNMLDRLNGMFGLALWDTRLKRLLVARDAMGIKVVYYRIADGQLSFGSEIRAIFAAGDFAPEVDPEALEQFLQFRYTPSPRTIFQGVRKLPPGGMLLVEKGRVTEERWYSFRPEPFGSAKEDVAAVEELLALYRAAVKRHLLSDVPVGVLLSGGLDSGLLLALMNENGGPWPAYSVGYGDIYKDDELRDAAETAARLGARHHMVMLDQTEFERSLPKIVGSLEEPVAASSVVPMYFVSQRARQDVKVVLLGQGPDELFGGYNRHLGVHYGSIWRSFPKPMRTAIEAAVTTLPRNEMLKRGVASLDASDRLHRYAQVFSISPFEKIRALFRPDVLSDANSDSPVDYWRELMPQMETTDELGGFQLLEVRSSLPDELLMYADKLSMAHGLEARVPYLDRTVVEFAQRLKASFKIRRGTRKWLHRQVCRRYLPPAIMRRKKRGFAGNVVDSWFDSSVAGRLPDTLEDEQSMIFKLLDPVRVQSLLQEHRTRRNDNHKLLFSLVMFEQWLRGSQSRPLRAEAVGV